MVKALVTVKRVLDPYVKVPLQAEGKGVDLQHAKMAMNPFDEIAVEAALQLREASHLSEVVVLSIGSIACQETLRHALALGADRAILVQTASHHVPLNVAKIIQHIVQLESPQLVLMGKQSIDGDHNQTPQMLAGLLDWPQALFASAISMTQESLTVTSEVDEGLVTVKLTLPAVVSTDLRLNTPRYVSLPNIMKAKQKPLQIIDEATLALSLHQSLQVLSVQSPPKRPMGTKVDSLEALLYQLKQDFQ